MTEKVDPIYIKQAMKKLENDKCIDIGDNTKIVILHYRSKNYLTNNKNYRENNREKYNEAYRKKYQYKKLFDFDKEWKRLSKIKI